MAKRKLRVFISSAIKGLRDYRDKARDYLEGDGNCIVYDYGEQCYDIGEGQLGIEEACLQKVVQSDVILLIIDYRYGNKIQYEGRKYYSLTQLEYMIAESNGVEPVVFCRDDVWIINKVWSTNRRINTKWDRDEDFGKDFHKNMRFLYSIKNRNPRVFINLYNNIDTFTRKIKKMGWDNKLPTKKARVIRRPARMEVEK